MMKKGMALLLIVSMIFALGACGTKDETTDAGDNTTEISEAPAPTTDSNGNVDLTTMSSTMVFAEVSNMMAYPEEYIGRTVTMQGEFSKYEEDGKTYYSCVIQDATACCAQGIEFKLKDDAKYPKTGSTVTVTGVFETYNEGQARYCQLVDATLG